MAWDGGAGESWDGSAEAGRLRKMLARAEREDDDGAAVAFLYAHRLLRKMGLSLGAMIRPRHALPAQVDDALYRRIEKIVALTGSDTEGEAIAAFLMTRRLIARLGLGLADVIRLPDAPDPDAGFKQCYPTLDVEVAALRKRVRELGVELADNRRTLARYESAFQGMIDNAFSAHGAGEVLLADRRRAS